MPGGLNPPPEVIASWPPPNFVNPETRGHGVLILCCILGPLAYISVAARIWIRVVVQRSVGPDDWLMAAAMVPMTGMVVSLCLGTEVYGFGRHVWDNPLSYIVPQRKITFANVYLYTWTSACIKIALLLFYRRLTDGPISRRYRIVTWVSIGFVMAWALTFSLAPLIDCRPVSYFWEQFDFIMLARHPERNTHTCAHEPGCVVAASILSAIQDLIVTTMPAVLCWRLQMRMQRKLALAIIFGIGYLVCVVGVLRTYAVYRLYWVTYDLTWDAWAAWLFTLLELLLAAVCTSIPAIGYYIQHHLRSHSLPGSESGESGSKSSAITKA